MAWFYLSFASADNFLGACVVEARDAKTAVVVASACGLNPGGEIVVLQSPDGTPGPHPTYRLLSREDLGEGSMRLGDIIDGGGIMPADALCVTDPRLVN